MNNNDLNVVLKYKTCQTWQRIYQKCWL